jgi:hypothetical protein
MRQAQAHGPRAAQRRFSPSRIHVIVPAFGLLSERGRSSMVERQLPKLHTRVRFPSPAPTLSQFQHHGFAAGFAAFVRASLICAIIAFVAAERPT